MGPNKSNYLPRKPQDPGPGLYGTSHPYKEIGGQHMKQNKYTIVGNRKERKLTYYLHFTFIL